MIRQPHADFVVADLVTISASHWLLLFSKMSDEFQPLLHVSSANFSSEKNQPKNQPIANFQPANSQPIASQ
jgi:hypothetical protein